MIISRSEIWRICQLHLLALKGHVAEGELRWVCESRARAAWLDEMLNGVSDGKTYLVTA